MKIGPPPKPPAPVAGPTDPSRSSGPTQTSGSAATTFASLLETPPGQGAQASVLRELQTALDAGQLTRAQAIEQLVDHVVRARMETLGPALAERLRQALRQSLADDPVLAAKAGALGAVRDEP